MHGAAKVLPSPGFAVAAEEYANQPPAWIPPYDLSCLTSQRNSLPKSGTPLAHWHQRGYCNCNHLGEEMGEGQSVKLQYASHRIRLGGAVTRQPGHKFANHSALCLPLILAHCLRIYV